MAGTAAETSPATEEDRKVDWSNLDPIEEMLIHARVKLLFDQPFFGQLALQMELIDASDWCSTAATDGRNFYYNREFIKSLSAPQLKFLVGHEVLHCFPAGTMVPGAWKPIEEMVAGDEVIGLGGITSTVVNPMMGHYTGRLHTIKARGMLPIAATHEHPVMAGIAKYKAVGSRKIGDRTTRREIVERDFVNAGELSVGQFVQIPRTKGTITSHVMQFSVLANGWSSPQQIHDGVTLDAEVANFLGWYVAEGCTTVTKQNDHVSVVTLADTEREVADRLQKVLLDRFGVASSIQSLIDSRSIRLQFSSAPLGRWLNDECGTGATNKRVPRVIIENTDLGIVSAFMHGYVTGDGFVDGSTVNFGTVSETLAHQLQTIGARFGFLFNLHLSKTKTGSIRGRSFNSKPLYRGSASSPAAFEMMGAAHDKVRPTSYVVVEEDAIWTPITGIKTEQVSDLPIYNIETTCHTYAAGNLMTHNCVYDHIGRRGSRDPKIWNMANDYIVNSTLKAENVGEMPAQGLHDPAYTDELSSEEVYDLLIKNSVTISLPLDMHLTSTGDDDQEDGNGNGNGEGGSVEVTVMGKNGPPKLTKADLEAIRNEVRTALVQTAQGLGASNIPASIRRLIGDLIEPKMDWRSLLDAHVRSAVKDDYTFQRISRRTWGGMFIMPGQDFQDTIDITISIDDSGSLTTEMLRDLLSEVKGIMETFRDFRIKLFSFDTLVHNYVEIGPENIGDFETWEPGGGGGTSFECNWDFMKDHGIEPARFVMFTDGQPNQGWGDPNYCDTLFIIHGSKTIYAPFGVTAHYDDPNDKK